MVWLVKFQWRAVQFGTELDCGQRSPGQAWASSATQDLVVKRSVPRPLPQEVVSLHQRNYTDVNVDAISADKYSALSPCCSRRGCEQVRASCPGQQRSQKSLKFSPPSVPSLDPCGPNTEVQPRDDTLWMPRGSACGFVGILLWASASLIHTPDANLRIITRGHETVSDPDE
jgi:hypothetical protein